MSKHGLSYDQLNWYEKIFDTLWHWGFAIRHWFEMRFTQRYKC